MKQSLSKKEKLKSKKEIELLFSEGRSCTKFPIKMIFTSHQFEEEIPLKIGVSVSKRNFKKAVQRNQIKRLLRESYRLNKHIVFNNLEEKHICMFLYIGKEKPTFHELNSKMERLLQDS